MFFVHLVSVRSGLVPVAAADSVSVPVAGSGLVSVLWSVFNRTPERTPRRVLHRRSRWLSALLACPATDLHGLGSLPLGLAFPTGGEVVAGG